MIALEHLAKEYKRLCINLERAEKRQGVSARELEDIKRKIEINLYLQEKCE